MAAASCEIKVGFRSSAEPGTTNSQTCVIRVGFAVAATPVNWAGNEGSRNVSDWLPPMSQPVLDPRTQRFTKPWWNYFRVLGERLGGVQGQTLPQVLAQVVETQDQVASNVAYTDSVAAFAAGVSATAAGASEVAQTNGLSGAGSIPPPPPAPSRPYVNRQPE